MVLPRCQRKQSVRTVTMPSLRESAFPSLLPMYWNGIYPFIDYSTGGSINGTIDAADANLAATTDRTIIIPGHGQPVSNRSALKDFRDMLVAH